MNIILFKGQFQYDVVNCFSEELNKALCDLGCNAISVDVNYIDTGRFREFLACNHIDLVLSFNSINIGTENILEDFNIPWGSILVDPPFNHIDRIQRYKGKNTFFCMYDEGFLSMFEQYIDARVPIAQLMHGGSYSEASIMQQEKIYDVLVAGSLSNPKEQIDQLYGLPDGILKKVAIEVYEKASENYNKPLYIYFKEVLDKYGLYPENFSKEIEYQRALAYFYTSVDSALRAKNRYNIIDKLVKMDVKVEYFGSTSIKEFDRYPNFTNHGAVGYYQLLEYIAKSKILIHDISYMQNGSHERFLSAMLNNTLVVGNTNNYGNGDYVDGQNIVYFDNNNLDTLIDKVKYYLVHNEEREAISKNAFKITSEKHTWKNRAQEILDIYECFRQL